MYDKIKEISETSDDYKLWEDQLKAMLSDDDLGRELHALQNFDKAHGLAKEIEEKFQYLDGQKNFIRALQCHHVEMSRERRAMSNICQKMFANVQQANSSRSALVGKALKQLTDLGVDLKDEAVLKRIPAKVIRECLILTGRVKR